jgi:DNA adenine methylase
MTKQLVKIKGQFVMSTNDVPDIRANFAAFEIQDVETSCSIAAKAGTSPRRKELIISYLK